MTGNINFKPQFDEILAPYFFLISRSVLQNKILNFYYFEFHQKNVEMGVCVCVFSHTI